MPRAAIFAFATLVATLGGCTTTSGMGGTDVTRYHLGQPIQPSSVVTEPVAAGGTISPEYRLYADAVAGELARLGFAPTADTGARSDFVAAVSFARTSRGVIRTPPKFSIGIGGGGGGGYGGGVGLGGGISTGIGSKTREVLVSELAVQLRRRSDGTIVWEGRAQSGGLSGSGQVQPNASAAKLAAALFKGFPGESGLTITVP